MARINGRAPNNPKNGNPTQEHHASAPVNSASEPAEVVTTTEERKLTFDLRRTLAIALIGTVAASGVATYKEGNAEGLVNAAKEAVLRPSEFSAGMHMDTSEAWPQVVLTDSYTGRPISFEISSVAEVAGRPDVAVISSMDARQISQNAPMPWAEQFASDSEARNTNRAEQNLERFAEQLSSLQGQGFRVESVNVRGFASDDDDTRPGAGLGVREPKNVELANVRARSAANLLVHNLSEEGVLTDVKVLPGKELINEEHNKSIDELASEKGVSVLELVQQYNRDRSSLSPAELKVLDELKDDRFVTMVAVVSKQSLAAVETKQEGGKLILIPFILPIFGLRRKTTHLIRQTPKLPLEPLPRPLPVLEPRGLTVEPAVRQKQPRPYNYTSSARRTQQPRSWGGGRRGKRTGVR